VVGVENVANGETWMWVLTLVIFAPVILALVILAFAFASDAEGNC